MLFLLILLSPQDAQLKFFEFSLIGFPGAPGFPGEIVERKLLFQIMTGAALRRIPEHFSLVKYRLLLNMAGGNKIPVNVATPAIVIDDPVAVRRSKIPVKGFFDFLGVATRTQPYQD